MLFASKEQKLCLNAFKEIEKVLTYMDSSFITKDTLLSSSGLIPIYYWFYRTYGKQHKNEMRNFLVQFESNRKKSRKVAEKDLDYVNFDVFTKSLNDQASLQGGYNILVNKWNYWQANGTL